MRSSDPPSPLTAIALTAVLITGCASSRAAPVEYPGALARQGVQTTIAGGVIARSAIMAVVSWSRAPQVRATGTNLQCVPYARGRSGIDIFGDANTWWTQAAGRFERGDRPRVGAVIAMGGTPRGHIGVVTRIISDREILVDHANWLGDGEIQTDALMVDASAANDWSHVYVWHAPSETLGVRPYPVQGFIGPG